MDKLISVPDAAKQLGVSETVVRRLTKRGDLIPAKVQQVGQQTRRYFRAGDVEALRQQRSGLEQS
jgi:DNA-binding transcriptional MerR regulator